MKKIEGKLAIFAGRGELPKILIKNCQKNGVEFQIFLLASEEYEIDYSEFNPISVYYGEAEKFLKAVKENNIKKLIFIGAVNKPNFSEIKADKTGAILIAKIVASKILGDDAVLRTVIKFFEKQGLEILKIDDLLDDIVSKKGVLSVFQPDSQDYENIELAKKAIMHFSKFDVGQALIVAQKQIIAVEAIEGTDAMIKRCNSLKIDYKDQAILVKMKKIGQSAKADLPVIGVDTIVNCHENGIKGIAIQAGKTLIINKEEVVAKVNELGLFLVVV